jgi:hypothetical protein
VEWGVCMKQFWLALQFLPALASSIAIADGGSTAPHRAPLAAGGQAFVKNVGQLDGPARYYAQGPTSSVYFEPSSVLLDRAPNGATGKHLALRVDFPSARRPVVSATAPQAGGMSAFLGKDPSRWHAGAPRFGEVRYQGVAPGADAVYRIADGRLEYDLVLSPGADLSRAVLRYRGAKSLSIDPTGELVVHTALGELREEAPRLYQEAEGIRTPVRGGYRLVSKREVGFWAEDFDPSRALIVDPGLMWSTFLGGNATDYLHAVASDLNGNLYVVGMTNSTSYPTTIGVYQPAKRGGNDVVVSKLRPDGSGLLWSTHLGGSANDEANGVAVDGQGNVYVCGYTCSTDFPTTSGAFRNTYGGGSSDGFVAKLNATGTSLSYSTYLGGSSGETPWRIALTSAGEAVVGGNTSSADFPTTSGVVKRFFAPNLMNASDGFLTKLNANGSGLVYSTFVGSESGNDAVNSLALDANGLAVVVGGTLSPDFPTTAGAFDRTHDADWDAFAAKLNAGATAYVFSTFLGGVNDDEAYGVAVDVNGNVYVTGRTASPGFPVARAAQSSYAGGYDAFVTSLTPDGGRLNYSTFLGGSAYDEGKSVAVMPGGQACVVGSTQGSGFPQASAFQGAGGGWDAFVSALTSSGSLSFSSYLGGSGSEAAHGLAFKPNGQLVIVGLTDSNNYPTTTGAMDRTQNSSGMYDGFVAGVDVGLSEALAVPEIPGADVELSGPAPNPFSARTALRLSLARDSDVRVVVIDLLGRTIRTLIDRRLPAGALSLAWDGRDDRGQDAGAGVFVLSVVVEGGRTSRSIVRLR